MSESTKDQKPFEEVDEFGDEPSGGVLPPNEELEAALRDAVESMEGRDQSGEAKSGKKAPPTSGMSLDELAQRKEEAAAQALGLSDSEEGEPSAELEAAKDRLIRLQADFENFRRRTLKDRDNFLNYGHENLVKDLLPTVDNLERAIAHAQQSDGGDLEGLLQGVELVLGEFLGVLAKHGVSRIEAMGGTFDPEFHEAMAQEIDNEAPANTVLRVFQEGYRLRNRLLRPTRVVVSKPDQPVEESVDASAAEPESNSEE